MERNKPVGCCGEGDGKNREGEIGLYCRRVLPESQSGFRKGRGCIYMIFVTRQLVEKAREHNDTL